MSKLTAKHHCDTPMSPPLSLDKANKLANIRNVCALLDNCLQEQLNSASFNRVQMIPPVFLPKVWGDRQLIAGAGGEKGGYLRQTAGDTAEWEMYFALQDTLQEMIDSDQIERAAVIHNLDLCDKSLVHYFIEQEKNTEVDFMVIVWTKSGVGCVYMIEVKSNIADLQKACAIQSQEYSKMYTKICEQLECEVQLVVGAAVRNKNEKIEQYKMYPINNCGKNQKIDPNDKPCDDCFQLCDSIKHLVADPDNCDLRHQGKVLASIDLDTISSRNRFNGECQVHVFQFNVSHWKGICTFLMKPVENIQSASTDCAEVASRPGLDNLLKAFVSLKLFSKPEPSGEVDQTICILFGGRKHHLADYFVSPHKAAALICRKSLRLDYLKQFRKADDFIHDIQHLQTNSDSDSGWLELAASEFRYLTDEQYKILGDRSLKKLVICGQYGTGKTLLLMVKAGSLVQKGQSVTIVAPENVIQQQYKPFFEQHFPGQWRQLVRFVLHDKRDVSCSRWEDVYDTAVFIDELKDLAIVDGYMVIPDTYNESSLLAFTAYIVNGENNFCWCVTAMAICLNGDYDYATKLKCELRILHFCIRSPPQITPQICLATPFANTAAGFFGVRMRKILVAPPEAFARYVANEISYWKQFVPNYSDILIVDDYENCGPLAKMLKDQGIAYQSSINDTARAFTDNVYFLRHSEISGLEYKVAIIVTIDATRRGGRQTELLEWATRASFGVSILYAKEISIIVKSWYPMWFINNSYCKRTEK